MAGTQFHYRQRVGSAKYSQTLPSKCVRRILRQHHVMSLSFPILPKEYFPVRWARFGGRTSQVCALTVLDDTVRLGKLSAQRWFVICPRYVPVRHAAKATCSVNAAPGGSVDNNTFKNRLSTCVVLPVGVLHVPFGIFSQFPKRFCRLR